MNVAFGLRAHSGWAALVVLGKQRDELVVIDRSRIELVEETWAKQPYHAAETLEREAAQKLVKRGVDGAGRLALREMKAALVWAAEKCKLKTLPVLEKVANTPGSEAGLQPDDLITAVDGQPAASLTEGRIEHLFMQEGREVALTIRRSDKELKVRLKLRRLI